jgi:tetratricopeptide (TPR) repeat protein
MARKITKTPRHLNYYTGGNNCVKAFFLCLIFFTHTAWSTECFLAPKTLPTNSNGWLSLQQQLDKTKKECLNNSVYLALYGAAQLNSGQLPEALESLERALLLDENNGAALIDYASALYYSGQIFSAIDLNNQILARSDLPENVIVILRNRAKLWEKSTQTQQHSLGFQTGYDSNLNNATHIDSLILNSPGGDVSLHLNDSSKAIPGKYTNLKTSHLYINHSDFRERSFLFESNTRFSHHSPSNYLQLSARYQDKRLLDQSFWYWSGQLSYLHYNQKPLSLITAGTVKYQWDTDKRCQSYIETTLENLSAIQQSTSNSISLYPGVGLNCRLNDHMVEAKMEAIIDHAKDSDRAGGNQYGWRFNLQWQKPLFKGVLHNSLRYTQLSDQSGYDPLLERGDKRKQRRATLSMEYTQFVGDGTLLSVSMSRQNQKSNIKLFEQRGTRISVELKKRF